MTLTKIAQALVTPTQEQTKPTLPTTPPAMPTEGLAKLRAVMHVTGISRSGIYEKIKKGEFPAPVKLGLRAVAWRVENVREFIAARVASGAQ